MIVRKRIFTNRIISLRSFQKISFNATWICRDVVVVAVISPEEETGEPVAVNRLRLLSGGKKLVLLKTLKASTLNWASNPSLTLEMRVFLKSERSNSESPGPISELRRELPSRVREAGKAKQLVLMYCF